MQSTLQSQPKTGKILEIDGARALSIIFVLLVHVTYGRIPGGFLGVDIFFVVSGYLITMLLLQEHAADGSISLRNFYARRVLRILPALSFACLLAVALPYHGETGVSEIRRVLAALFFHSNFLSPEDMGNLAHTWSLSIEEQFYLVWPAVIVVLAARGRGALLTVALLVICTVIATRVYMVRHVADQNLIYTFTLAHLDGIMIGCAVALAEPVLKRLLESRALVTSLLCWSSFIVLLAALIFAQRSFLQATPWAFFAFASTAAIFVFCAPRLSHRDLLRRLLCWRPMQYIGQRSYGLYLYHYPIFGACEGFRVAGDLGNYFGVAALKIGLSLIVTELAWRLIEKPALALKPYFQNSPRDAQAPALSPTTRSGTT